MSMSEGVASISANADGATVSGEVLRLKGKYVVMVAGTALGGAVGSSQAAAQRLIHALAEGMPSRPESWGVSMNCSREDFGVSFGNSRGGGGGGSLHPCAEKVLKDRRFENLEDALRGAAQVIGHCCG